ncbi:Signal transduction histidine kinase, contains PAS domain [Halorhabdus sp. SVX81]|uniref:sensor histidine kinase n=1 Tax=Halorhabdus sp. SVX81 TaxID=2978283 RepID=UPI0023DA08C2|nr:histidine kinase N-terminal 7TM domain-containing protein [Halorhabdus sp. SVX81]WEL17865.1 Signal transduction histidine kinase, contains PAS domain [Halorhabdus sp. SVX81]
MDSWLAVYQAGLLVAIVVSIVAAKLAWRHRDERGGMPLTVVLAAEIGWAVAILVTTVFPGTSIALAANKALLAGVVVLVPALVVFALEYTGRESLVTRRLLGALSVEPVVFMALVWTNEAHGLVWKTLRIDGTGPRGLETVNGPLFGVHTAYSYLLLSVAVLLIVVFALRSRYFYQRQIAAIVLATLVPWAANAVSLALGLEYDLTPIAFTVTGVAFTWAVAREEFLDITPIATEVVFDRIDTAVVVVDTAGRVVDINESARELLGVSDIVGESIDECLGAVPDAVSVYESITDGHEPNTQDLTVGDRAVRMESSPLVDRRDEVVGYALIMVDLTEEREREATLTRRNEQLDRFVGVVSHDLRNPLQVAAGRLEHARREGKPEQFAAVERAHSRMERLIEDLLTLARQNEDLDPEQVELEVVAKSAWSYVETGAATLELDVEGVTVEADPDRMSQLFENLFRNSIEHGGEDVTVIVEGLPARRGFAVTDDGSGFDKADPEKVFEDGYTTTRDGTGFGLSIVAEIATQHGWAVSAIDVEDGARIEVLTGEATA